MKKSRVVSLILVVLLCAALVLAATEATAARPSPKVAMAKGNAAVTSTLAQGRSALQARVAAGRVAAADLARWVRALPASVSRCAKRVGANIQRSTAGACRVVSSKLSGITRASRAAAARCGAVACKACKTVRAVADRVARRVSDAVPACVKPYARDVVSGACSVVTVRRSFSAQAAGAIPATPATRGEAIWSYTTSKFLYGLSAGLAELALIRVLYREPHGNHRTNRCNRFCASLIGWPMLVAAVAVPNGLVEAGMLIVMVLKLSPSSFRPAIIVGHLVRPYVVAVLRTCPYVRRAYAAYQRLWPAKAVANTTAATVGEVLLWLVVVWAIMFISASLTPRTEDEDTLLESGSEAEEQDDDAETPASASKPVAKKPRAKASPAATRKPRKATRSSSKR